MMSRKIVLADDHKIVRDGLCGLLEKEFDLDVVAEAEDDRKAVELVREHGPDAQFERHRCHAADSRRCAGHRGDRFVHALPRTVCRAHA